VKDAYKGFFSRATELLSPPLGHEHLPMILQKNENESKMTRLNHSQITYTAA